MRRLLLLALLAMPAFAARTTVTGLLTRADGSFCNGSLSISWPTFTSVTSQLIYAGSFTSLITNGAISVSLEPSSYYTVNYLVAPSGCTPSIEFWVVPVSGTPVDISVVRTVSPPPPLPYAIPLSWILPSGATNGQCAAWNGTNWVPSSNCGGGAPISGATTNCIVTASSATTLQTPANCPTIDSSGTITLHGTGVAIAGLPATTVSGLPTCNSGAQGTRATVTDANATTFLSTVAGSGSNVVPVICDGTNWKIG